MKTKRPRYRWLALVAAAFALTGVALSGQEASTEDPERELYARLSAGEREAVAQANTRAQEEIRVARAELEIVRAQLNRLLLDVGADLKEVERLLRQGLEWELKARVAEITREREIRKIVGDRRWAELVEARNLVAERARGIAQATEERIRKMAQELSELAPSRQERPAIVRRLEGMLRELVESSTRD